MINTLEGQTLTDIRFVHDYLQLVFDHGYVTVNNPLTIIQHNQTIEAENPSYKNYLMSSVGKRLLHIQISEKEARFSFDNNTDMHISLKEEDYTTPEALIFHIGEQTIVVP